MEINNYFIDWNCHIYGQGSTAYVSRELIKTLDENNFSVGVTNVSKVKQWNRYLTVSENKLIKEYLNRNPRENQKIIRVRFARIQENESFDEVKFTNGIRVLYIALPYSLNFQELTSKNYDQYYDFIWVNSVFTKKTLIEKGISKNKIFVIPHGVNKQIFNQEVQPYKFSTSKTFNFLNVSIPYVQIKGLDVLIRAYIEEFNSLEDVCLILKNRYLEKDNQIQAIIDREKKRFIAPPEIIFVPGNHTSEEMASIYTSSNCYIQPSRIEGYGLPVLEAMACGLPVIVTGEGGMLDFTRDDFTYYIDYEKKSCNKKLRDEFPELSTDFIINPSVIDLRKKMRYMFSNRKKLSSLGEVASNFAHKFHSWQHPVDSIKNFISKVEAQYEKKN